MLAVTDKPARPRGRPSGFTQEIADNIINRVASGESLKAICRDDDSPAPSMIFRWLAENHDFRDRYAHARAAQADAKFDEISDVAARVLEGDLDPHAARVFIDAVKWQASKLAPAKYGDRIEHIVRPGAPAELTDDDLARIAQSTGTVMTHVLPSEAKPLIEHESVSSDGDEQGK